MGANLPFWSRPLFRREQSQFRQELPPLKVCAFLLIIPVPVEPGYALPLQIV